jgi:streptogramin lyase
MRLLALALTAVAVAAPSPLSGARSHRSCAGAGPYWPTETLALHRGVVWVACKEQQRLVRIGLPASALRSVPLDGQPIAVVAGFGALWALDSAGVVSRVDPASGKVSGRVATGAAGPYNLWVGAGSLWSVDDRSGEVLRIDPVRRKVSARIMVGDGPADIVFRSGRAWVINHRDRGLVLIDTARNKPRRLATVPGDAPERLAWASGSLWATGRGTDLIRLDPKTGGVQATVEIGAGGIDVIAAAGSLWVPARNAAIDRTGFPTMAALRRVDPATSKVVTPARASRRVDVHGLVPFRSGILLADNTSGRLYEVPG